MPEGDSIHRLAARLRPVLEGRFVKALSARRIADDHARSIVGCCITAVEARGKNLLVRFDDGRTLHIHLKMDGRVFIERPRSRFWKPAPVVAHPDLRLEVDRGPAVIGKELGICRLFRREDLDIGPDLLAPEFDVTAAIPRLRALKDREIADALLTQRAVAGIGNVYKSEVLFLEGVHPRRTINVLDDEMIGRLLERARELLKRNVAGPGPRITTRFTLGGGARRWVYGRGGRPCLRCQTPIVRFMQGPEGGRSTYFCPTCQPP